MPEQGTVQIIDDLNGIHTPPGAVPYARRKLKRQSETGGEAIISAPISRIVSAFVTIVNAEGPISKDIAKQRVLHAWATRRGKRINDYLDEAIAHADRNRNLLVKGNFLWPVGMTVPPLRIHVDGQDPRPIVDIPPEEIELAIRECVNSAVGITVDDLVRETCRLFGLKATTDAALHIEQIIKSLTLIDVLRIRNDKLIKGKNFSVIS